MSKSSASLVEELAKSRIRDIPDYPKPGIIFKDITPLMKDKVAFSKCIDALAEKMSKYKFDYIAGIEARGFIIGSALAYKMNKGFIPIRKKGKLPYKTASKNYLLEYGTATIEVHQDAVEKDSKVMIVDDLLATGGTAFAGAELIRSLGAEVVGFAFIIELTGLDGRKILKDSNIEVLVKD